MNIEELYRRHAQDVYRFAYWLCGDRTEAEDVVSDTFLAAWTSSTRPQVSTVKAYLLVIARHVVLKRRRRAKPHAALQADLADKSAGPERLAEQRDELTAAMTALQALPEADRAALLLRAQQDLPYEEIARVLGVSVSAAKVKVHRARIKLAAR